jgi:hypothetical protein
MANQHQEIIESCVDELGINNISLNNLGKDLFRADSIANYDISNILSSLDSSIEMVESRLNEPRNNSDYKKLLDLLFRVQDRIRQGRVSFDRRMQNSDILLSQILARNHSVYDELVKIRDEDSYF